MGLVMNLTPEERDAIRVALFLLIDALDYDALKQNLANIQRNEGLKNTLCHGAVFELIDKI